MAKLKCRCGHKFAEALADLQQQGITRLKCPACGLGSTIPAATQPNLNDSTTDEIQSQAESLEPSGNDFFANFDSQQEVYEPASTVEAETARDVDATVRHSADSLMNESTAVKPVAMPDRKSSSRTKDDGDGIKVKSALHPWEKEYLWILFWLAVSIGVIVASYPSTNPLSDFSPYNSYYNRFLKDNAVGATANAVEWMAQNHPKPSSTLVTNLLLLAIAFLLWKLHRTISSQQTEAPPAR